MATAPITLDFSKMQPIPQAAPVTLDFSKAVPIPGVDQSTPTPQTNDWLARALGQKDQTDLENFTQPTDHSASQGVLGNIKTGLSNIGAYGINALTHPEQLVTGAIMGSPPVQAYTAIRDAIKHYQGQPNATDQEAQHPAQTVENAIGTAGALGGPELAGEGVGAVRSYLRPTPSPSIVPRTEMAARNLAAAVLPAGKDAPNFIQAAQQEVPNILDYAKRTGNPLNTQLEFSKAAQGYAQEVRGVYENGILGPNANNAVKTTGTGFGARSGEGPDTYATLGDIDKRVTAINQQLDAPAMNADDARRALASKTDLQTEASKLRDILHQNLSQATGIEPEDIANIRQRVGRSYELANDVNAAVTQRMQAQGKAEMAPISLHQIPGRAIQVVQGGMVPVADRAFQRAIANFPGQPQGLPTPTPPAPIPQMPLRPSLAQKAGIQVQPNPLTAVPMDADTASAQVAQMNQGLAARGNSAQAAASAQRAAAFIQSQRLEQLLAIARKQQESARSGSQ